jgi:hypothetical protein
LLSSSYIGHDRVPGTGRNIEECEEEEMEEKKEDLPNCSSVGAGYSTNYLVSELDT